MRRLLFTISTLAGCLMPVFAQQDDDASRGVARVSVVAGEVSVRRGDSGDNIAATLNAPLVAQDRLLTGPGSRAELQFDYANMVRLGANTEVRLAELQYQRFQINLAVGLVTYRVWQNSQAEVDINTPVASVRPLRKGEYRIQVLEDGTTEIAVRDGELDIFTPQGSRKLGEGRSLTIRREANGEPSFVSSGNMPIDSWDQWNRSRDRELSSSRSSQYLPQGVYGGEQLDNNGDWTYSAPYGYVWSPRVAAGWAPYRSGRWSWLDWYGWTWVSYDPWGWAPYHYGRWFNNAGRWCWWPGAGGSRHYWSPALVSFVGFGRGGIGVGFGWGNVGWVPLAPFETYNRWWGRGYYGNRGGFNNVRVVNNVNITNIYRNARVDGGVSYVEANNFNRGVAYAGGNGVRAARASDLGNASEFRGPLGIAPNRESVRYANDDGVRGGRANFSSREDQSFTSRRQAASVERVPFDQQRQNVEQMARGAGMTRTEEGVRGAGSTPSSEGFRRVGERDAGAAAAGVRGSSGFVQRDSGVRGGSNSAAGAERNSIAPQQGNVGVRGSEGFVTRQSQGGTRGESPSVNGTDAVRGGSDSRSGWQRFGDANVNSNSGVRGSSRSSDGFVQRDNGSGTRSVDLGGFDGGSRSRGVGAVDVSPRIVERGSSSIDRGSRGGGSDSTPRIQQRNEGSGDPFGGSRGGGASSSSGWGSFGGVRGGGSGVQQQSAPRGNSEGSRGGFFGGSSRSGGSAPQMSSPSGGFGGGSRGGGSAPRMGAPSGGGSRGGGSAPRMSAPSGGGSRGGGGGAAPARSGGGGGGGRRGGGQ
jgi:hypothetical protein